MKKILLISLLSLSIITLCQAQSTTTNYTKGYFVTKTETAVQATNNNVKSVVEKFIQQYRSDLNGLFTWALKGMKLKMEKDDFIMFNIKSHTPENNYVAGIMDLDVPFLDKKNKNVAYKVKIGKKEIDNKNSVVNYEMIECEKVIEHAIAQLNIIQKNEKECVLHLEVKIKMKFPYSMMTKKQYEENIEWRFTQLLENLKHEMKK
jgi:hypothetical protein